MATASTELGPMFCEPFADCVGLLLGDHAFGGELLQHVGTFGSGGSILNGGFRLYAILGTGNSREHYEPTYECRHSNGRAGNTGTEGRSVLGFTWGSHMPSMATSSEPNLNT